MLFHWANGFQIEYRVESWCYEIYQDAENINFTSLCAIVFVGGVCACLRFIDSRFGALLGRLALCHLTSSVWPSRLPGFCRL